MVVATGLEPGLAPLGQVHNSRPASLPLASPLCSPRFRLSIASGDCPTGAPLGSGLAPLGQVHNSRLTSLPLVTLLCSPRFRLAASRTAGARLRAQSMGSHRREDGMCKSLHKTQIKTTHKGWFSFGGRNRTRTCDPIDVNDVLWAGGRVVKLPPSCVHMSQTSKFGLFRHNIRRLERNSCLSMGVFIILNTGVQGCSRPFEHGVFSRVQGCSWSGSVQTRLI